MRSENIRDEIREVLLKLMEDLKKEATFLRDAFENSDLEDTKTWLEHTSFSVFVIGKELDEYIKEA